MAQLIVHGGAGAPPEHEYAARRAAVDRALEAGWARIGAGALEAAMAAVRHLEDEPALNAGVGACLNADGEIELDAGVMEGTRLAAGGVGAVRDVRHPVDLARAVMDDGRHVLLVADGASRFARERGLEMCDPAVFMTDRQRARWEEADTVGAAARDDGGQVAVAVSTGGRVRKLPGRLGDASVPGAGFYADDRAGGCVGTGFGEYFLRLALSHWTVERLRDGVPAAEVAERAIDHLDVIGGSGGVIVVSAAGELGAAFNTPFMAWASRDG